MKKASDCGNVHQKYLNTKQVLRGSCLFNQGKCSKRTAAKHDAELDELIELNSIDFMFSLKNSSSLSTLTGRDSCCIKSTTLDLLIKR
jgi:hypothetical protein